MPMPVSATVSVLAFLSGMILIFGGAPSPISSGFAIAS
jgi:preprotein translocase subunit SecE